VRVGWTWGFSFASSFRPDHWGLAAPLPNRPQTGRSERQRPGKRKIGGDLQGEPIFRLPGPSAGLLCAVLKAPGGGDGEAGRRGRCAPTRHGIRRGTVNGHWRCGGGRGTAARARPAMAMGERGGIGSAGGVVLQAAEVGGQTRINRAWGRGGDAAERAAAPGHRPQARQGAPDMTAGGTPPGPNLPTARPRRPCLHPQPEPACRSGLPALRVKRGTSLARRTSPGDRYSGPTA
jgi:hypothetical protein